MQSHSNLRFILQSLTDREKKVISCRFGIGNQKPMTLEQIGQLMDVTRERVRQIEAKAIHKMRVRTKLCKAELSDFF